MQGKLNIIHVVKRYGPVGGMERYVWEVTRELQRMGHRITVLCERCHVAPPEGINVVELGETAKRPRWLSQVRFSARVTRWVRAHSEADRVIHSHERVGVHDVTTFHGPPFATIFEQGWWRFISLRVWVRLYLERRELETARVIVPNSSFISRQLERYYPELSGNIIAPVVPGVLPVRQREPRIVPADGGVVCFVGWEWQRKGLPMAMDIVAELRRSRPNLELWVVGPPPAELEALFAGWQGGCRLMGWREDNDHFREVDVLLHPALAEPYGMVIAEAMAARVPVVVSDVCGAAEHVVEEAGAVLPLAAPFERWVQAVEQQLARSSPVPVFERSWAKVASEYESVYLSMARKDLQ
ncbi:MAG: glycosyltransferase family 4 protein [Gallionella sp.]|nr:glycosyltransferase family 4 protein [Gallionella sp.]MDD4945447.1 glycosyltransferase family 4 protein [Gallionella sp.]MDD5611787.1 glycosyltransferase family 4 protein [Gallionella sp.]